MDLLKRRAFSSVRWDSPCEESIQKLGSKVPEEAQKAMEQERRSDHLGGRGTGGFAGVPGGQNEELVS